MMYNQKFVACLKANNKVLKETDGCSWVPFGSEFSILLKNLNSVRAVVNVSIDGKDALGGDQLVVDANSSIDLERFLNGNQNEGRRFKFIERTSEIEDHRGVGSDDGLIRIEFQYEIPYKWAQPNPIYYTKSFGGGSGGQLGQPYYGDLIGHAQSDAVIKSASLRSASVDSSYSANAAASASYASNSVVMPRSMDFNDAGITVQGSKSEQQFQSVHVGTLDSTKHVIVLQMKGVRDEKPVVAPVTVATRKTCPACGTSYKSSYEYCAKDGAYLG